MGLAIGVGMLARASRTHSDRSDEIRRDLEVVNEALRQRGLPEHEEPQDFDEVPQLRASVTSFPYSWIHNLRRFAAHVMRDPKWIPYPLEPREDPAEDPVLHQMYRRMESHLLCHSDREGYYVPVDFDDLIRDPDIGIRGVVLGSSYRLREELLSFADTLEIEVDGNSLSDEVAAEISKQRPTEVPFAIERLVWLALFEAARVSIEEQTAIVFH